MVSHYFKVVVLLMVSTVTRVIYPLMPRRQSNEAYSIYKYFVLDETF